MISRRTVLRSMLAGPALLASRPGWAQAASWPDRTVRIIMPFPAGAAHDSLTRVLADELNGTFGQAFIIENRPGAGGNIGMSIGLKAKPDGYTVTAATVGTLSINQFLYRAMPYDPEKDTAAVSMIWDAPDCLMVASEHNPARTLEDFVAWAKAKADGVTYGSAGIGTTPHLAGELFCQRTGIRGTHVPYRDSGQRFQQLLAGALDFAIDNLASYGALIKAGRIHALASTTAERWPTLPDVPTMGEAGLDDFVVTSWGAFVVPTGTPPQIVTKLSDAIRTIAAKPAIRERFLAIGGRARGSSPEELTTFAASERRRWGEVLRSAGIKAE